VQRTVVVKGGRSGRRSSADARPPSCDSRAQAIRWRAMEGSQHAGAEKKVVRRRERASKGDSAFSCESANDKQALSMGVAEWVPRVPGWRSPIEMGAVRVDVRQTCCRHIRACDRLGIEYFAGTTGFPPL